MRNVHFKSRLFLRPGLPSLPLKFRQLGHLSLKYARNPVKNAFDWHVFMKALPKTLEYLDLPWHTPLLNLAPEWTSSKPVYIETSYPHGVSRFLELSQGATDGGCRSSNGTRTSSTNFHALLPSWSSVAVLHHLLTNWISNALPSSLTILRINGSGDPRPTIPPSSLANLKQLDSLHLNDIPLQSQVLRYLPNSLRYLTATFESIEEVDAPFIPTRRLCSVHCQLETVINIPW